jgi:hypothetical protein
LIDGGPLGCSRVRWRVQCHPKSCRQHETGTPNAKGRASWQ